VHKPSNVLSTRGAPALAALGSAVAVLTLLAGCAGATAGRGRPDSRSQAEAQGAVQGSGIHAPSRRELEARAAELDRQSGRRREAAAIRARLREGDFQVGDVVVLRVAGVPQFSDTFAVRAGRVLELPEVAPIPLTGVLRSELQPYLRRQIGRYVIDPNVEAHSLVRVAVAGAVHSPGYYQVRPDALVSDAVMRAGGLAETGDATKVSLRRGGRTVIGEKELRGSMVMGATLDDLNVRAGDELHVGTRPQRNWLEVVRTLTYVVVVATGLWGAGHINW
jgi:protein involved in polysaccharide export with SLBB domain